MTFIKIFISGYTWPHSSFQILLYRIVLYINTHLDRELWNIQNNWLEFLLYLSHFPCVPCFLQNYHLKDRRYIGPYLIHLTANLDNTLGVMKNSKSLGKLMNMKSTDEFHSYPFLQKNPQILGSWACQSPDPIRPFLINTDLHRLKPSLCLKWLVHLYVIELTLICVHFEWKYPLTSHSANWRHVPASKAPHAVHAAVASTPTDSC